MRVVVRHTDEDHPNHDWFAYEQGRILGFRDPISGTPYAAEQVADALLTRAQDEFPETEGYEHQIETLHIADYDENGNEIGAWFPVGESDLPRAGTPQPLVKHELSIQQAQAEGVE